MRKLKTFWYVVSRSATDPTYYVDILKVKLRFSLTFYVVLLFLLSILDSAIFRLREFPTFLSTIQNESMRAMSTLPPTFKITYTPDGKMIPTGITLPFSIPTSSAMRSLITNDTLMTFTDKDQSSPHSFITMTPVRSILHSNEDAGISAQSFPYKDIFDTNAFSLTKDQLAGKLASFFQVLPSLATLLACIAIPFWYLGLLLATTVMLFILSLILNSLTWFVGIRLPLLEMFQLGLHAIGIATLLDVIKFMLYPKSDISLVIPAYLGIMVLALWSLRSNKKSV